MTEQVELLLDIRHHELDKYVDKFVISESTYTHSGKSKKLIFDMKKYSKFKDKITHIIVDKEPETDDLGNEQPYGGLGLAFKGNPVIATRSLLHDLLGGEAPGRHLEALHPRHGTDLSHPRGAEHAAGDRAAAERTRRVRARGARGAKVRAP